MRFPVWAVVIALAGCKRDHPCEKFADLVSRCTGERMNGSVYEEVELRCRMSRRDKLLDGYNECAAATTCEALDACFAKHQCSFIVTGPDDPKPQLTCAPP